MSDHERYLLVITKNKSSIILECLDTISMKSLHAEAGLHGATCERVLMEDFYPTYRGYRYFDLRNSVTRETFSLLAIIEILDAPLEDHGEAEDLFGGNIFH